jgi:hypothetical protein
MEGMSLNFRKGGDGLGMKSQAEKLDLTQTPFPLGGEECNPERQSDFIPQAKRKEELEPLSQEMWDSERQSSLSAAGNPNGEGQEMEEDIEEEWQTRMLEEEAQPDHDWWAQVAKCLIKDFPQGVQDLFQDSNQVEAPSYGSNSSEPVRESISQELDRLVEPESQKEGNLTDWRTESLETEHAEWEEVDACRKDSWSTRRDNVWDSTDKAFLMAFLA